MEFSDLVFRGFPIPRRHMATGFLLGFLCVFSHLTPSFAQEQAESTKEPGNGISLFLSAGFINTSLADRVLTPRVYRGLGFAGSGGFETETPKYVHQVRLNYMNNRLRPQPVGLGNSNILNLAGEISYRLLRKLSPKWQVGPMFRNNLSYRAISIIGEREVSWDLFSSLNLAVNYEHKLRKQRTLNWSFSLPAVAFVAGRMRLPKDLPAEVLSEFFNDDDASFPVDKVFSSGRVLSLARFVDAVSDVTFRTPLGSRMFVRLQYQFRYTRYPQFENVKSAFSSYSFAVEVPV